MLSNFLASYWIFFFRCYSSFDVFRIKSVSVFFGSWYLSLSLDLFFPQHFSHPLQQSGYSQPGSQPTSQDSFCLTHQTLSFSWKSRSLMARLVLLSVLWSRWNMSFCVFLGKGIREKSFHSLHLRKCPSTGFVFDCRCNQGRYSREGAFILSAALSHISLLELLKTQGHSDCICRGHGLISAALGRCLSPGVSSSVMASFCLSDWVLTPSYCGGLCPAGSEIVYFCFLASFLLSFWKLLPWYQLSGWRSCFHMHCWYSKILFP